MPMRVWKKLFLVHPIPILPFVFSNRTLILFIVTILTDQKMAFLCFLYYLGLAIGIISNQ